MIRGMLKDTSPEAERVQIRLLRAAGPRRRAELASSLTNWTLKNAWAGMRRARPGLSERELQLLFVRINYGKALAEELEQYLEARGEHAA
jgi:hypothetical protein